VDFFHKSLKDWLVNDKNRTYFISYKRGKERIEEFFQTLTPQTYKEEYLKLIEFNKKLLNHIYKRDDDLKSYFALLEKIKDDKKKIEMLNSLWVHFHFHNKMRRAIKIQEEIYDIVKPLYQKEEDRWAEDYTTALINLATSYKYNDRAKEAIALEEESLEIRKELYQNNPDRWAEKYTTALNNLAFSYSNNDRAKEAIELEEESLKIRKVLYQNNPDRWAEDYTTALNNLAFSYIQQSKFDKALELIEQKYKVVLKRYGEENETVKEVKKEIEMVTMIAYMKRQE